MKNVIKLGGAMVLAALIGLFLIGRIEPESINAAASVDGYTSLDETDPIEFGGSYIVYQGEKITLGEKAIFLDGSISDEVAAKYPYVYNDVTEALSEAALKQGSEADPMVVYIAPYVYWLHDPDATDTVQPIPGVGGPYGMVINCDWLNLQGLSSDPYNVVIAANRGQSHGSNGNYTMFKFNCKGGLNVNNLTLGNYCSIDLDYKLKPELSHARRTDTITQAQLASMSGDKMFADNCNFLSRLNLMPINGGKRSLYNDCHFESTDDAINGNAVFLNCDFDFYGNRPLGGASKTGSTFLDCKFNCVVLNVEAEPFQYFTKAGGTITAVDCEFISNFDIPFNIGWTKYPDSSLRCYQYNILHNGKKIMIGGDSAKETVDMTGSPVLSAYRVVKDGKTYYNTYNLLKGTDGWDPLGVKDIVTSVGAEDVPTMLTVSATAKTIESGATTADITSKVVYYHGAQDATSSVSFYIDAESEKYAKLTDNGDGTCKLEGINNEDETKEVLVYAKTDLGLCGAVAINVKPSILEAPAFTVKPVIENDKAGKLKVNYTLDLGIRADQSLISWYRCSDDKGSNPILVAVSRLDDPEYEYELKAGDVGYYIMAKVEPKHIRSNPGEAVTAIFSDKIAVSDVRAKNLYLDFKTFPTITQGEILPGFWTVSHFRPADTEDLKWQGVDDVNPFKYGETGNGSVGFGLYQGTQGARMMYTPVEGTYGDMTVKFVVDPSKTAGQGFGSANQYMDVCLKFDTTTLTGYGLRIIRTTAASDAVNFVLVKYDNGIVTKISDEIMASCFVTDCQITLSVVGNKLTAHVETSTAQLADQAAKGYVHSVDLTADITQNSFGGVSIQHTGTTGTGGWQNTTMYHSLSVEWAGENNQNPENPGTPEIPEDPETPVTPENPVTPEAPDNGGSAQTGDTMNAVLWIVLALMSATAAFVVKGNEKIAKR